jgi:lincosamide nucleotidyltransferase A/C/D/E
MLSTSTILVIEDAPRMRRCDGNPRPARRPRHRGVGGRRLGRRRPLGEQTRADDDLDLVITRGDCSAAQDAARPALGLEYAAATEPGLPARLRLRGAGDRRVDLHPLAFVDAGNGWQELPDGNRGRYSAEGLRGVGTIAQRRVRSLTPERQVRHHLGYEPDSDDHHDMHRLGEHFQLEPPPPYGRRTPCPPHRDREPRSSARCPFDAGQSR